MRAARHESCVEKLQPDGMVPDAVCLSEAKPVELEGTKLEGTKLEEVLRGMVGVRKSAL